jgi:exopolysaccharide biosynthesis polyprenyl glycosylphosphotransferase
VDAPDGIRAPRPGPGPFTGRGSKRYGEPALTGRAPQSQQESSAIGPTLPPREQPVGADVIDLATQAAPPGRARFSILRRRGAWRDALRRRMLAAADLLGVMVAATAVAIGSGWAGFLAFSAAMLPVWLVLAKVFGLYDRDHRVLRHMTVDELPNLIAWVTTGTALHVLLLSLIQGHDVSPSEGVGFWICLVVATPLFRAAARAAWRRAVPAERSLLVGSGPLEVATRRKLDLFKDIHVQCVGMVSDEAITCAEDLDPILLAAAREAPPGGLDRVIVASQTVSEPLIAQLVRVCRRDGLKLSLVPPARAMFGTAVQLHHIADLPMIEYTTWDVPRSTLMLKRIIDVVVGGLALVVLAPLLLVLAVTVKLNSRGPILFLHHRAGKDGKPFRMLKFRTMVADAEERLSEVVDLDALEHPTFKLQRDPRVTRVGRFLRRTSLDEIPQFFNVLHGDMSLVGPRPEQVELVERYAPEHRFRLDVRPGLTGPMQVYGRGDLGFDERLAVEREYVENLSLRRDFRIMLLTLAAVLRGHGAY